MLKNPKTVEGGWSQLVSSAAASIYGFAFYDTVGHIVGGKQVMGVASNGDFLAYFAQATDDFTVFRLSADEPAFTEVVRDDDGVAGSELDTAEIIITDNGSVFYLDLNTTVPRIKYIDSAGVFQWGYPINTNAGSEDVLDICAYTDPSTGLDRLFVAITGTGNDDTAVYEVDIDSPGTNAVGNKFNVQWANAQTPTATDCCLVYDPVNDQLLLGGSGIGYATDLSYSVIAMNPNDTTTSAVTRQVQLGTVSTGGRGQNLTYDAANNQVVAMINGASQTEVVRLDATDLSYADGQYFTGWAGNADGMTTDGFGNLFMFNGTNNEMLLIDDSWNTIWQIDPAEVGLTTLDVEAARINENGSIAIVIECNDSTYDWIAVLLAPAADPVGLDYVFTSPNAATTTLSLNSITADTWTSLGGSSASFSLTVNQTEFTTLNLDTAVNYNDSVVARAYSTEITV